MENLNTHIDIHSTTILSDIASKIQKPLAEIKRIQEYKQANRSTDYANLDEVLLENSEVIEKLIAEMVKIEKEKKVEIKINDSLQFPELINKYRDKSVVLFKEDVEWLIELETLFIENISLKKFDLHLFLSKLYMSERTFFRKVKALTGITPKKYFSTLKLYYAKRLMEKREIKSVNQVVCKIGFNDHSYFTNIFIKEFGNAPSGILAITAGRRNITI